MESLLIPLWVLSILFSIVSLDSLRRAIRQNNWPLYGKAASWGIAAVLYMMVNFHLIENIEFGHALTRAAFFSVALTELAYRWTKRGS